MESLHASLITKAKAKVPGLFALQPIYWKFFIEVESSGGAGLSEAVESKAIESWLRMLMMTVTALQSLRLLTLRSLSGLGSQNAALHSTRRGINVNCFIFCSRYRDS